MKLLEQLTQIATDIADGHFTVMKFTTNWRVMFGTPMGRCDICDAFEGKTFEEAAMKAIEARRGPYWDNSCACLGTERLSF
jgi:hypothetical protein